MVRYADDAIFLFETEKEAKEFYAEFKTRMVEYGLTVNEEKSRLMSFQQSDLQHFNFLGFTFYWGIQRNRRVLKVKTEKNKLHRAIKEFYNWIKSNRSRKELKELWETAKSKLRGHYQYFGYKMNQPRLGHYYMEVEKGDVQMVKQKGTETLLHMG